MSRGPKAVALELAEAERAELRRLLRRRGVGQALAQRIRVVLACAEPGATNLGVATAPGGQPPDGGDLVRALPTQTTRLTVSIWLGDLTYGAW